MQVLTFSVFLLVAITGVASRFNHGLEPLERARRSDDVTCNEGRRFRRFDGQCNNLANPEWGSVGQHFERIAAAAYSDAAGSPRANGENNEPLPAVREVSQKVHPSDDTRDDFTLMVMQWGQFMDHDITATAESEENGAPLVCTCTSTNSHCFNIPIDVSTDEHFQSAPCLEFARSEAELVTNSETNQQVLEQTNVVTSYIDASMVYGSSSAQANNLRRNNNPGSLRTRNNVPGQGPLLPRDPSDGCILEGDDEFCFLAGDFRVNEMPGLAALHTIFVREHNRIARFFRNNANNWSENRIYQETRKIVGAMIQHINYNEYLPIVLAPAIMEQFRLGVDDCFKYDPELQADIINSFATAAFRFGHSQIPEGVNHGDQFFALELLFSRPGSLFERFDNITGALAKDRSMTSDGFFARSVTRHLVLGPGQEETDLISRNLQRGRDHGLPSLNEFRRACGLDAITSFGDLNEDLEDLYNSVEDIDLFTGGMLEERLEGGLLGPTFSCIMGRQFNKLKFGDRFFYTTQDKNTRFTYAQLNEIKKATLSRIICLNSENKMIQPNIFVPEDYESNSLMRCGQLPRVNLRKWL